MNRWPTPFFILCGVGFLGLGAYEWCRTPLTPLYARSFGIDTSFIGFIGGASTITGILLKFPAGICSDVFGRRPVLLAGIFFFAATPFLYPLVSGPWSLLGVRFLHGCATAMYSPVAQAVVADLFKERRAAAMGWYTACGLTGRSAGSAAAPWVLGLTGAFSTTYLIAGPIGIGAILLAFFLRPPKREEPRERPRFLTGLREAVSDFRVIFIAGMEAIVMCATGAIQQFLPLYATQVRALPTSSVGFLFSAQLVTSLLSRPFMGMVSDRVGRKPMIVAGMIGCAVAFVLFPRFGSFPALLALSAIYGFAEAVIHTSSNTFVADICKQRSLGSAMGIFGTIMDVGHAAGPVATGWLLMRLNQDYAKAFLIIGATVVAFALLFLFLVKPRKDV